MSSFSLSLLAREAFPFPFFAMACLFSCEIESEIKVNSLRNPLWTQSEVKVIAMWNQSESTVKSNWIQCEIPGKANEINVKSKWNKNDIKQNPSHSNWNQSEFKVSSKWTHSESKVKSKRIRSELKVNSKWAPTPLPPILLSSFGWLYRNMKHGPGSEQNLKDT